MTTIATPAVYRTAPIKGEFQGVDREREVIRGVAVMQRGDINDGDPRKQFVDDDTFKQFIQMANAGRGIKARFTHPDMSNDGLGSFLGRWKGARIDGDTARADLHISPRSHNTPTHGDVGNYVLDLAESDPDMFGASMATMLDDAAMEKSERDDGFRPIRMRQLHAIDVVDTPALTTGGLFSTSYGVPEQVSRMLDTHFAGVQQTELRQRALGYLDRYLTNRFGEIPMPTENNTPAALTRDDLTTFGADLLSKVDERLATLNVQQEQKPTDVQLERKRCSDLFATAKSAGLEGYDKIAQDAVDGGLTIEQFKASIADRLISQNKLSNDSGELPTDPEAKYKREYQQQRAAFASMGTTEAEYITSRKIDDGLELLAPSMSAV